MEVLSPECCSASEFCSEVDDLGRNLQKGLHIGNVNSSDGDAVINVKKCKQIYPISYHNYFGMSVTFPDTGKTLSSITHSGEDDDQQLESVQRTCTHTVSLPTPLKLVSALKGSRERLGIKPEKLTVKWAPDVYDPIPTTVSHTVKGNKKKSHKNKDNYKKKNGKKGQKGKGSSSAGGGGRRKHRKSGGSSDKCYEQFGLVKSYENMLDDFDVSNAETSCGTSFLKESACQMHYAVAEAM